MSEQGEKPAENGPETGQGNKSTRKSCAGITASGAPCQALSNPNSIYCTFHSTELQTRRLVQQGRVAGGKARLASRSPLKCR